MPRKDIRRHQRIACVGLLRISWTDGSGALKLTKGRIVNLSQSGIRVESQEPIPIRSLVSLRAEEIGVQGGASVRYCVRSAGKFNIGLEFSTPLVKGFEPGTETVRNQ